MRSVAVIALLATALVGCTGAAGTPGPAAAGAQAASVSPGPLPSREPTSLPELKWERDIVDALRSEGISVTLIGGSKFDTLLGPRLPARVFIDVAGGEGADVILIEDSSVSDVRVCTTQLPNAFWSNAITVDGRVLPGVEGSQRALYSMNGRFFVQAFGDHIDRAIRNALGTSRPNC